MPDVRTDVVVVGGGVLGTMHAWEALERGHRVVQVERDAEARSASVRNFGLVWVSGRRDGAELELAHRARERWERIGSRVPGVGFRAHGSLTVAITDVEADVMRGFAASDAAPARSTTWLDRDDVLAREPGVGGTAVLGALWCAADAIVETRVAQRALREAMTATGRYRFVPGRHVVRRDGTTVYDHAGDRYAGDVVILCTGAVHDALAAEHLVGAPVRRRRLQMMQTAPLEVRLGHSIADADSMRYYPAYARADLSALPPQPSVAARFEAQLLLVQRLDGSLTIGDTHDDEDADAPFPFDVVEDPYEHLVARAEAILGRPLPPIRRRWAGVYSVLTELAPVDVVYHHAELEPGVVLVTGPGGRGMTLAPAIAERTWSRLA